MNICRRIVLCVIAVHFYCCDCYARIVSIPASLSEPPSAPHSFLKNKECEYTLPDLHGNALKLLHALITIGTVIMPKQHYQNFTHLYFKPLQSITPQNLSDLRHIIAGMSTPHNGRGNRVRFIGDELSDRGRNDYFTLLLIQELARKGIKYEFIISNHSFEFIQGYERKTYRPVRISSTTRSLIALGYFLSQNLVEQTEIQDIIEKYYKPHLKILSYSLSKDKTNIIIYTHAPVGLTQIKKLADFLGTAYKDKTPKALANTIDDINDIFHKKYVSQNLIHTLDKSLDDFTWNRKYAQLDRPSHYQGYKIKFVHGHDAGEKSHSNIYNLDFDNYLGKRCEDTRGNHQIFVFP